MSWSREQVQLLLEEYQKYPCLYAVKDRQYKNKHARQCALNKIEEIIKMVKPAVSQQDIKNKFHGLKTNFMAEYKKMEMSKKSGAGEDEIYKPGLWYFDLIKYVLDHNLIRPSVDSIEYERVDHSYYEDYSYSRGDATIRQEETQIEEDGAQWTIVENVEISDSNLTSTQIGVEERNLSVTPNSTRISSPKNPKPAKKKKNDSCNDSLLTGAAGALKLISETIGTSKPCIKNQTEDDDADLFGRLIAIKLRNVKNPEKRIETERKIMMLLYSILQDDEND